MRFLILCALLIISASISAQTTNADNVRIRKELTLRSITLDSFLRTISSSATHRQGLTAKALYDYIPLTSTAPTTGKVLKWNGTAWTPAVDSSGGYYQTLQANGTSATQRPVLNFLNSDPIAITATDNAGKTDVQASINSGSITSAMIENGTVTSTDIANSTILFADWAQNSATTTNNIPKWNGSAWAAAPDVGATVSNGIINDAGTLKIGGSFPSNRILSGNGKLIVSPLTGTQRLEIDKYGLFLFDSTGYISRIIGEYHAHQMKNYWSGSGSASGITGMETTEDDGSYFSTDLTTGQKRFRTSFSLINTTPTATSKWEFLSEDTLTASALDQGNFWIKRFSRNTSAAPRLNFVKRKQSGAIGTNTFLSNGENMGQITFSGDETSTKMSGVINAYATEAHSASAQGGKVVIATTPNGSTATTDRATIDQNGDVILHSYTSARSDTNTIYGIAGFDPSGKLIRKTGSIGGGTNIYNSDGTLSSRRVVDTDGLDFFLGDFDDPSTAQYGWTQQEFGILKDTDDGVVGLSNFNSSGYGSYIYNYGSSGIEFYQSTHDFALSGFIAFRRGTTDGYMQSYAGVRPAYISGTDFRAAYVTCTSDTSGQNASISTLNVSSDAMYAISVGKFRTSPSSTQYERSYGFRQFFQNQIDEVPRYDWIKVKINDSRYDTSGNNISFYGNSYRFPNSKPTAGTKRLIAWDGGATPTFEEYTTLLKASATLNFPSTTANTVSDLTITVTGAADGDVVSLGVPNAAVTTGGTFSAWVSASNTVTVRYAALATSDPASGTFKVVVSK